jgi:hypothetical protein
MGPSWSWVSVESAVRYWEDVKSLHLGPFTHYVGERFKRIAFEVRMLQRRPHEFKYGVRLAGRNHFGQVVSAVLRVKSYSRVARLLYPDANETTKYRIAMDGTTRPFFADYILTEERSRRIAQFEEVTLLLIHPQIALVLCPTMRDTRQYLGSPDELGITVGAMPDLDALNEGFWMRIGIIRVSDTLLDLYQEDWMSGAVVSEFNLV